MKYQVGDEILVLHSHEEGRIIEIMNDQMVMIEVRGVKFPAYMDQIDFPYFKRFTDKKLFVDKKAPTKIVIDQLPKDQIQQNNAKEEDGVFLNLVPKFTLDDFNDEVVESLKIHLSNKTKTGYQFEYAQLFSGEVDFSMSSTIPAFSDFQIHAIPFASVNDSLSFTIDFSLAEPNKKKAEHFETHLKIKPKQLFNKIEALKESQGSTINYNLFEQYPDKLEDNHIALDTLRNAGFKVYDLSKIKQNLPLARSVVDLHIEKLIEKHQQLNNAEIIQIQLDAFEKWFDIAQLNHLPSMIIIHGVGKGKLKSDIHDLLKAKKGVKNFINQFSDFYGFGATEVFFEYKT